MVGWGGADDGSGVREKGKGKERSGGVGEEIVGAFRGGWRAAVWLFGCLAVWRVAGIYFQENFILLFCF